MERIDARTPALIESRLRDPEFEADLVESLWYSGEIWHLLRPGGQQRIQSFIADHIERDRETQAPLRPIVVETHRRLGKSTLGLILLIWHCLSRPGQRAVFALPTFEMASQIVLPNMEIVLASAPNDLIPKRAKWRFTFTNPLWPHGSRPSYLDVVGVNARPDSARGAFCDRLWCDEAGFMEHLEYFISSVMAPQFQGREDAAIVLTSTPPPSMAHDFIAKYCHDAHAHGRLLTIPATENPDYTRRDDRIVVEICGGKDSIAYRREALCEHVSDEDALVVPEYLKAREEVFVEFEPPECYIPFVSQDLGYYPDYTHILFCGIDFVEQRIMVFDEIHVRRETLDQIGPEIHTKERALWTENLHAQNLRRWSDGDFFALEAFRKAGLKFASVVKHDRDARIANMRRLMQQRRVRIHPRCIQLDYQLRNTVWNDKRTDWERDERVGHGDGLDALSYGMRMAPWKENPFPDEWRTPTAGVWEKEFREPEPEGGLFDSLLD